MSETRCPSAPATTGATVIGAVGEDGRVAHFATTLVADEHFLAAASAHGAPEKRFRFSSPCAESRCVQWNGEECGLIGRIVGLMKDAGAPIKHDRGHACVIRAHCRWRLQSGDEACGVCSFIVTDGNREATEASA